MLEGEIPNQGCNHTRAITDAWLVEHGHPLEQVHQWLEEHGGYCDCEVLANAEQAWRFASAK